MTPTHTPPPTVAGACPRQDRSPARHAAASTAAAVSGVPAAQATGSASAAPAAAAPAAGVVSGVVVLERLEALARQLAGVEVAVMPAKESVRAIGRIEAMLAACRARILRTHAPAEAEKAGAASQEAWVAQATRQDTRHSARNSRLAAALADASHTEQALGCGQISDRHAEVITDTLTHLPDTLSTHQRTVVERELVRVATQVTPTVLRREARRALAAVEPDPQLVDAHENQLVLDEEDRARDAAWFRWYDRSDGTTKGEFLIPTLQAHLLKKVLHTMAAPRRTHHGSRSSGSSTATGTGIGRKSGNGAGHPGTASTADHSRTAETGQTPNASSGTLFDTDDAAQAGRSPAGPAALADPAGETARSPGGAGGVSVVGVDFDAVPVTREQDSGDSGADLTWGQRLGRAFTDLLTHLPTDHLTPTTGVTLVVTIDETDLRRRVAKVVGADTADTTSASQLRRLACQAGILPAVLAGPSVPVDLGRRSRLYSDHQKMLLSAGYQSCAADGCDRPFAWCELHHLTPWSHGGTTDLTNALPLCSHHHHLIHHPRYTHTLTTTGGTGNVGTGDRPPGWRRRTNRTTTTAAPLPTYTVTYRQHP